MSAVAQGALSFCPVRGQATGATNVVFAGLYYSGDTGWVAASGTFSPATTGCRMIDGIVVSMGNIDLAASSSDDFSFIADPAVVVNQPYPIFKTLFLRRTAYFTVY